MQVLGLCESYWRIYSLALMVVGEIICEEFLRLCATVGLSTALVLLHLPWHNSSIGKQSLHRSWGLVRVFGESPALIVRETINQQFLEHCQNNSSVYSFGAIMIILVKVFYSLACRIHKGQEGAA